MLHPKGALDTAEESFGIERLREAVRSAKGYSLIRTEDTGIASHKDNGQPAVNGAKTTDAQAFQRLIGRARAGDEVLFDVLREGKTEQVKATLAERP